jgi:Cu-Zn family superoxide dismutase
MRAGFAINACMRTIIQILGAIVIGVAIAASSVATARADSDVTTAIAVLHPTQGSKVHGVVKFTKTDDLVKVTGEITGLAPGLHGFHIHEFGDCSSSDGKSAGGHFNPTGVEHGGPDSQKHHVGDLGNIEANGEGVATVNVTSELIEFEGDNSILGRGLIVHAGQDDLKSQPSGNAGGRVACGVIGIANTSE